MQQGTVDLKVPGGPFAKEPNGGDSIARATAIHRAGESLPAQTDYTLEKHLLWLKNSNLKQTPPQTYKIQEVYPNRINLEIYAKTHHKFTPKREGEKMKVYSQGEECLT